MKKNILTVALVSSLIAANGQCKISKDAFTEQTTYTSKKGMLNQGIDIGFGKGSYVRAYVVHAVGDSLGYMNVTVSKLEEIANGIDFMVKTEKGLVKGIITDINEEGKTKAARVTTFRVNLTKEDMITLAASKTKMIRIGIIDKKGTGMYFKALSKCLNQIVNNY